MAFPTLQQSGQPRSLQDWWRYVCGLAGTVKDRATALQNQAAAGNISAFQIIDFTTLLADAKVAFNNAAAVSGLGAYAQTQVGNGSLNVVTEFNAMVAQVDATILWVRQNLPNDGTYLLMVQLLTDGRYTYRTFTPAQTAGFRTQLAALIATIE